MKIQIAVLIVLFVADPIWARNEMDDVYDIFSKTADADDPNRLAMKQAIASKEGDAFLKAYLGGDTKIAQTHYANMLKRLEKIETIDDFNNLIVSRFALDIPEAQPLKTQYSGEALNRFMLSATEKAVTKNHRFYGDCLGNLARILEKEQHWKEAISLREQQYELFQKLFGAENEKAIIILTQWGVDEGQNKNFPQGELLLKKSLAVATKHTFRFSLKKAGHAYFNLLMDAHRPSDAVAFRNNLLNQFPNLKY